LAGVRQTWDDKREEVDGVAIRFNDALRRQHKIDAPDSAPPNEETFKAATLQLVQLHNAEEGGFSDSQQFPQEGFLLFLLDHWRRTGEEQARAAVATTLEAIAAGGIHDHIGGGFHRYTVDPNWRTPHFEKMLYNQALLARAFIEGWEATARPAFRRAAERAFTYVLRDMTDPEGAFYAAEDADSSDRSEKVEEGAFYVWPIEYVRATLGRTAERAIAALGLDRGATVEAGPVAHLRPGERVDFEALDPVLARLLKARAGRQRPLRDDKIIAGWNGLMIRALAEGAVAFGRADLAEAALRAAETLWQRHWDGERLWRLWVGETACEAGLLDDYAWFGLGCLALHEATAEPLWLERATTLAETAVAVFADDAHRLKMAAEDGPLGPIYESADGATPAGESAMLELLARLGGETGAAEMLIRAGELRAAIAPQMVQFPLMRPEALMASRIMDQGRSTLRRVLSQGRVRAQLKPASGGLGWRLMLSIAEGWHLNAHEPGPNWLVGATIEGADTEWPEGRAQTMDFSETEVAVYTGLVEIDLMPEAPELKLRVQACSERVCLEPVSTIFRLP
ncbi:MAG: protein-disulfide reductase DsbD domain-containing protein, partial [Pseudomonadota bacterium]